MLDTNLRARSASEIIDASFALYRQHAMQLIVVTAVAMAPSIIYTLLMSGTPPVTAADVLRQLPVVFISLFSYTLLNAVVSRMASDFYLGGQPDIAGTLRDLVTRLPAIIIAMIVLFVLSTVATIFLILPVFWVAAMFFATIPIIMIEKKGPFAALSRSAQLSKGQKWHILGTLALAFGIYVVLSIGLSLGAMAIGGQMLQIIVGSLYAIVVGPVVTLAVTVLYYDTRIRKEGFDVEHMAASLNSSLMAPPMPGPVA